jgi:hypothetical protein
VIGDGLEELAAPLSEADPVILLFQPDLKGNFHRLPVGIGRADPFQDFLKKIPETSGVDREIFKRKKWKSFRCFIFSGSAKRNVFFMVTQVIIHKFALFCQFFQVKASLSWPEPGEHSEFIVPGV